MKVRIVGSGAVFHCQSLYVNLKYAWKQDLKESLIQDVDAVCF